MGPVIHRLLSPGSGQLVGVASVAGGVSSDVFWHRGAPFQSAAVFVPPSLLLLMSMMLPGPIPVRKGSVTWSKFMNTSCPSAAFSSVATHWRSSITPGLVWQPNGLLEKLSPRSREMFIVTQTPERSAKKTLWVTSPTAWCESPPPPAFNTGRLSKYGLCAGTRKV